MIRVRVRDKHAIEARVMLGQPAFDLGEVKRIADAGVDEHGAAARQEIGVVAPARHRARIVRLDQDRVEHDSRNYSSATP